MGCTNSINAQTQSEEQPVKKYTIQVQRHQTQVIKIEQPKLKQTQEKPKNQTIVKKQEKIKQLKNNKDFIQVSIETSYCVNKLLNTLAQNQMFKDYELKGLMSKNNQALMLKQNRYKNLEAREEKMELQLRKQLEKNQRHINLRKSVPVKTRQEYISQRKNNNLRELTNIKSQRINQPIIQIQQQDKQNNQLKHSYSDYLRNDYKSKFIKKIDMFRSQVNTLVPRENIEL